MDDFIKCIVYFVNYFLNTLDQTDTQQNEMIICVRMAHLMKADHNLDIKMNKLLIASTAYNGTNVTPA